jgi:hypothetical protein
MLRSVCIALMVLLLCCCRGAVCCQARPSIDTILRMPYVKTHLARYAQHVMR